jgi:glycosyltransferase involved in cell wall biosynthesis
MQCALPKGQRSSLSSSGKSLEILKLAFVHGRPGPHPFHGLLAESVGSDFVFVDYKMRWHDRDRSRIYRYASMLVCGSLFPRKYDVIISEGPHSIPVIARSSTLFGKRPKAAALLDNESLYFLKSGFYPQKTTSRLIKLLRRYDALVCVGDFQFELAEELLSGENGERVPRLCKVHSSIKGDRIESFAKISPELAGRNVLFIGNGPSGWRSYYKGLDVLLDAMQRAVIELPDLTLTVVGEWEDPHIEELLNGRPTIRPNVFFAGKTTNLRPYLERSALYVHPARGEAFGITIIEAMCAGVPCIVSDQTGAKEAVLQVSNEMVTPVDASKVAEGMLAYFALPWEGRTRLSAESRRVAQEYTEARSIREFRAAVESIARS